MFRILKSSKGLMDLQSVIVGIIITAIVSSIAIVSIVGLVRMTAIDTGKSTLRVFTTGMESYYTDNDRYPQTIQQLADGGFVPKSYVQLQTEGKLCMAPGPSAYPQSYVTAIKVTATGDVFAASDANRSPQAGASGNNYCFS